MNRRMRGWLSVALTLPALLFGCVLLLTAGCSNADIPPEAPTVAAATAPAEANTHAEPTESFIGFKLE